MKTTNATICRVLDDLRQNRQASCFLPLVWQYGASPETVLKELRAIRSCGIREFCLESKHFPGYLEEPWWRNLDLVLGFARENQMKVWVFDDGYFPTGSANGALAGKPESPFRRLFLEEGHLEVCGPLPGASILLDAWLHGSPVSRRAAFEKRLLAAVAIPVDVPKAGGCSKAAVDLTARAVGGRLHWDVPEGRWRIHLMTVSPQGGSDLTRDSVNLIDRKAVAFFLQNNYEPYWRRYQADFGKAFGGFFSDEPGFYNLVDTYSMGQSVGVPGIQLPWSAELEERLKARWGDAFACTLPALWCRALPGSAEAVYDYKDEVTSLYAECFTSQIAGWCHSRGVKYIGHVLEDNGQHSRLGSGTGHYFRAMTGLDYAGVDIVLNQIVLGAEDDLPGMTAEGEWHPRFFHYGLAKLGAAMAHLDPAKQGRALCEVFGAYGWAFGLRSMQWLYNHLLVNNINIFMPHAFSAAGLNYPEDDSSANYPVPFPPHFFCNGANPQFRHYPALYRYCDRIVWLTCGTHVCQPVAVLFPAEAEWRGHWTPFDWIVRELTRAQLESELLPVDFLMRNAILEDGRLVVNGEAFPALVVPDGDWPTAVQERLNTLRQKGFTVLMASPENLPQVLNALRSHAKVRCLGAPCPELRVNYLQGDGFEVFMLLNSNPRQSLAAAVSLLCRQEVLVRYDAWENRLTAVRAEQTQEGFRLPLELAPGECALLLGLAAKECPELDEALPEMNRRQRIDGPWTLAAATAEEFPEYKFIQNCPELSNLRQIPGLSDFSGHFRYECEFPFAGETACVALLELGEVFETAEVWLNDVRLGVRVAPPYRFAIPAGALRAGKNALRVEVTNTLAAREHDYFSRGIVQPPDGLLGPVSLLF